MEKIAQFNLLGPFEAKDADGESIEFGHRKLRALLAYLAVESSRPFTREHLASLLWSRTGDERARHNLRQVLYYLRAAIPDRKARQDSDENQVPLLLCFLNHERVSMISTMLGSGPLWVWRGHIQPLSWPGPPAA